MTSLPGGSPASKRWEDILAHLTVLYGSETAAGAAAQLAARLERFARDHQVPPVRRLDPRDALLITYGDQFQETGKTPLRCLFEFCDQFLTGVFTGVHILPFFPYTSDDGFSVVDYRQVDPNLGDWEDVRRIAAQFRLMVDAVLNHCSVKNAWFQGFLAGDPAYRDYFVTADPALDLSQVVRPRALPLLTPFETAAGTRHVWTTFSADQVDLNYANSAVLLEMIDILLGYVARGAQIIRLDAIAYLWKEVGTPCIHLPQTHRAVQLFRAVLELVAPGTVLITETNVPHRDNVAYFGDGTNEAQLVYNFALPPLTLHALQTGDGRVLSEWAGSLSLPSPETTFFNFLASHDGIGLNPARGLLADAEIERVIERAQRAGGLVSYKNNPDGTQSAYELNANYLDALSEPRHSAGPALGEARFAVAQAIQYALQGVPGVYVHSLVGSRGWPEGARSSGHNRTINRQKFAAPALFAELRDPTSARNRLYRVARRLLQARAASPAFDPYGSQQVIHAHPGALVLRRESSGRAVLCCHNLRREQISLRLPAQPGAWRSLLDENRAPLSIDGTLTLEPYQVVWLEKES